MPYRNTIEAFKAGDDLAFVSIYNRHKKGVYSFCLKMLGDRDHALDVMQDTFVRVFENRERLLNTASFKSWLYTIARNQCLNRIRRRGREVPLLTSSHLAASDDTPVARMEKHERIQLLRHFLQTLSPADREVLILREWQNLSYEEIGAVTRSTVSAVKSRLFKARRRLARLLRPALGVIAPNRTPEKNPDPVQNA